MTDPTIIEKAVDAMIALNAAITNLRLYPPASAIISNSNDKVYQLLETLFEEEDSIIFSESEKNLIISGQVLNVKGAQMAQVMTFVQMMVNFGIKSITFEKGLGKNELLTSLQILCQKPEAIADQGGLQEVIADKNLRHILFDQTTYVAVDKDQKVVSADDAISDEKDKNVIKFMVGDSDSEIDMESLRKAAKDPEWVANVFKAGITQIDQQEETTPGTKASEAVIRMINKLSDVVDSGNKDEIFTRIVESLANMDEETLSIVLTKEPKGALGENLFHSVVDQLDDEKFEGLAAKIKNLEENVTDRRSGEDRRGNYSLKYFLADGKERRNKEDKRKGRIIHVKAGLNSIMKGEESAFLDRQVMLAIPNAIEQLFSKGKNKTAENIIDRLSEGLLNKKAEVRAEVSNVMAQINLNLASNRRMNEMLRLYPKLLKWIELETTISLAYKQICNQLKAVAQALIRSYRFDECNQMLEVFCQIHSGKTKKNKEIKALSGNVMEKIASDDIQDLLKKEIETDEKGLRDSADNMMQMLDKKGIESAKPKPSEKKETAASIVKEAETAQEIMEIDEDLTGLIKLIDMHVQQNDTESAVKALFDSIVKYAKEKDFSKAEHLREKLVEVDPLALTEIVKVEEIIEEEKSKSLDQDHVTFWNKIYDTLNSEETNILYHALKIGTCKVDEILIQQGESNTNLYFIDEGQLKIVFHKNEEEFIVQELNPGDIIGNESFFRMSVCIASAIALSPVKYHYLEKESLNKWEEESLALVSKLKSFCLGFKQIPELLKEKGLNRRSQERIEVQTKMSIQLMDDSGASTEKALAGTLSDISVGGLAFYIKISKEKAASMFMGSKLNMQFKLPSGGAQHQIDQNGTIVGVHYDLGEYFVNVKFDEMIDETLIKGIDTTE